MIVGLLLAAGGARRFGSQKLVAPFRGRALVCHAAEALAGVTDSTIAVVGREAAVVRDALGQVVTRVVENHEWESGMASSVRIGIDALPDDADAVLIALGDQPGVDPAVGRAIVARWVESGKPIVVPRFRDGRGHPVLFARDVFDELRSLVGDVGARRVIERVPERVAEVVIDAEMPSDVDTPEDLEGLDAGVRRAADSP